MKRFVRDHKMLIAALLLVVLISGAQLTWWGSAHMRGRITARLDMARGRYLLLGYGLPPRERPEYVRLLRERYGVEFKVVGYCTVSDSLRRYADGYDEVSMADVKRKFGHDVFGESYWEAHTNLKSTVLDDSPAN